MLNLNKTGIIFLLFFVKSLFAQVGFYPNCVNADFEQTPAGSYTAANAVMGWSVSSATANCSTVTTVWTPGSSEFSIRSLPITNFPVIGTIPSSPFGGNRVAQLNDYTPNTKITRLAVTLTVTSVNAMFTFAFAGYYEDPGHSCCDQPGLHVRVKNSSGQIQNCKGIVLSPGCPAVNATFSTAVGASWTNWQIKYIDLMAYLGSVVTVEFLTQDCSFGGHLGTTLIDASCSSYFGTFGGGPLLPCPSYPVYYCANTTTACIVAPYGYNSYNWIMPPSTSYTVGSGFNWSSILINNPVVNSVYSVNAINASGCITTFTYAIVPGNLGLCSITSSPSCAGGSVGSATAYATGSATGYNFLWTNSSNSVVGTGSVASNLPPGVYNLTVSAAGATACGIATGTVALQSVTNSPPTLLGKPYCGTSAFFNIPSGSNFQWYVSGTAVTGSVGTQSSFTFTNPTNGGQVQLAYNTQGCRDSVVYTTYSVFPGAISTLTTNTVCVGGNNGEAVFSFTPSNYPLTGPYSFSVVSSASAAPYFTSSPLSYANSFSVSNLSAGIYSVTAFDGACASTATLGIVPFVFNYSLSAASISLCPGTQTTILCNFSASLSPSAYTYNWQPNVFLTGNLASAQFASISPTLAAGTSTAITYSVVVTPTTINCPLTKTVQVAAFHPVIPNVAPVSQVICRDVPNFTLNYVPANGSFLSPPSQFPVGSNGSVTPLLANYGLNTFTLVSTLGTCSYSTAGSFTVNGPLLSLSGGTTHCVGSSATLQASGASTYTWNTGSNLPSIVVSPASSSVYVLSGALPGDPCVSTKTTGVIVVAFPTLSIAGNTQLCSGTGVVLVGHGATSYTWSTGANTYTTQITPQTSGIFTLSGSFAGAMCVSSKTVFVNVSPSPTLNISGSQGTVCAGDLANYTASGASSYTWFPFGGNSPGISFSPLSNLTLSVSGSSSLNCVATRTIGIVVDACLSSKNKLQNESGFLIYPQPGGSICYVEFPEDLGHCLPACLKSLEIFNGNGLAQLVSHAFTEGNKIALLLDAYADGIYELRLTLDYEGEILFYGAKLVVMH